jgi:antitoxin MazE
LNATVQKWGNSLALRLPRVMTKDMHLEQGGVVDLSLSEGALIVRPRATRAYSLAQLLKGVTRGNRPAEVDWGPAAGREVW